jgi:hypothetical protein
MINEAYPMYNSFNWPHGLLQGPQHTWSEEV